MDVDVGCSFSESEAEEYEYGLITSSSPDSHSSYADSLNSSSVKLPSVTTFLRGGGEDEVCSGEEERERGGLSLEEECAEEEAGEELDRGDKSSGLAEGV